MTGQALETGEEHYGFKKKGAKLQSNAKAKDEAKMNLFSSKRPES